jgi:hypothetical protein
MPSPEPDKPAANPPRTPQPTEGLLPIGAVVQGYKITRLMRAGQSNNVYVATSPTGLEVAIKEYFPRKLAKRLPSGRIGVVSEKIKTQFDSGVKGFVNEAIALAEIKSDLLATYVAAFRDKGTAYIITALEPGETLELWARKQLKSGKYPKEADLRFVFWALLHAVQVMHDRGFLHLDIKPSNVMMRDENTPILIDLGGARRYPFVNSAISVSNYTPGFAAPEQHAELHQQLCPATDIYGIGSSILYCMTGKIPPLAADRAANDSFPEYIKRCNGRYTEQLIQIVTRCMAVKIDERYDCVKDLQNLISSQ